MREHDAAGDEEPSTDERLDGVQREETSQMTEYTGPAPVHTEAEAAEIEEESFESDG